MARDDVKVSGTIVIEVKGDPSTINTSPKNEPGSSVGSTLVIKDTESLLKARGLNAGGRAQQFVDSEVLRLTDPYVPMDSGALKGSGTRSTKIGTGRVVYNTPYARRQYYENKGNGLRGSQWFHRSMADNKKTILAGVKKITDGK